MPAAPRDPLARSRLVDEVVRHVNSTLDATEVMERAIDLLIREVGAERGLVMLRAEDGTLQPHALRRIDPAEVGSDRFRTSRTLLQRVMAEGQPILTQDAQTDQRLAGRASVIGLGLRSIIAVPLQVQEQVEGVVYLDDTRRIDAFSPDDLELVGSLSELIAIALQNARAHAEVQAARDLFARYVNHQVAEAVGSPDALSFAGTSARVSVLNCDIRGFSTLSRGMGAADVVTMLNEWLTDAVEHVIDYGGNVDKFIGDAILGVFGAPIPVEGASRRAVVAAVEIMRSVRTLNARRASRGDAPLALGAGIDVGDVVAGNIGSPRRLEYTVIGEAANNAAWLAALAGPMEILVTDAAWAELGGAIPSRGTRRMAFKGEATEHDVHAVDWEAMVD